MGIGEMCFKTKNMYVMSEKIEEKLDSKIEIDWLELVSKLPVGIVILNTMGKIQYANDFAIKILSMELAEKDWIDVVKAAFAPRQDDGHEISLKDGRRISLTTTSLADGHGQLVTLYDVTATREFQSEVASRMRLIEIGRMSAKLAHQIRTPLSSMLLYLSNLENKALSDEKRSKFVNKIKESIRALEQQVNDMLLYAKGGGTVLADITMADLFEDIESKLGPVIQESKAVFSVRNDTGDESFKANIDALSGAIQNLVHNAIQASEGCPEIQLKAKVRDSFIEIDVIDNGLGIKVEDIDNVKKPFFTTKTKGTGLGLSVVQAVVKAHYGEMRITSELNNGTRVTLVIPIKK